MGASHRDIAMTVLRDHGTTYAAEAGITLADKPSPLFRLLVLATLASTRISARTAAAAAAELSRSGWRTPGRMLEATWQERVDALGRAGYRRYDESTASALADSAELLLEDYGGDLRRLRPRGDEPGPGPLRERLQEFPRLGPVGADIFCREVQAVWPEVRPCFDARSLAGARAVGLPEDPHRLGDLVPGSDVAVLAAALTRVAIQRRRR